MPVSWWRSWDLYSVWEAQLRAREANELLSQNEIAGCQNVFPPFLYLGKSGLWWSASVGQREILRDKRWCRIPASAAHGGVITSYDFFTPVYCTLVVVVIPGLLVHCKHLGCFSSLQEPWKWLLWECVVRNKQINVRGRDSIFYNP